MKKIVSLLLILCLALGMVSLASADEEFVLDSGRRAFCYKTSDASTCHVIIDGSDINPSGNALIKITIGSADLWLYTYKDLANMVDKGF